MKYIVILFSFISSISLSQVLDNSRGEAFTNKPFFNKTFIAKNKIKSIKGRFNYKQSGKAMYPTEYYYAYNFDEQGQLVSTFETRKDDGTVDTTWNEYVYNSLGLLQVHKQGIQRGKMTINYSFDDKNRIISEQHLSESIDSLGVKSVVIVNEETMDYHAYEMQVRRTKSNSYGLPYMTETFFYDENGYLLEEQIRFLKSSNFSKRIFTYNDKGLLASIQTFSKDNPVATEEEQFNYDAFGNLMEKKLYRNGVFTTETQIIYNEHSKLMTAVIIREVKTDFLMVIRFGEYEFYK